MPLAFIFSSPPNNMPYTLHVYAHFVWISIYGSVVVRYVWCSSTSAVIEMIQLIVIGRNHVKLIWWLCFRLLQQGAFWRYFFRAVDFLEFKNNTLYNFGHSDMVKINCIKWADFKIWYTFWVCNHFSNIFEIKILLNFHIF